MGVLAGMVTAAVIGAGASIYAGSKASSAAKSASKSQIQAQQEASASAQREQARQFDIIRELLSPYISAGRPELTQPYISAGPGALQQMQRLTGLGGEQARQQDLFQVGQSPQFKQLSEITQEKINQYAKTRRNLRKSISGSKNLAAFDLDTNTGIRDIESQGYAQQKSLLQPIIEDKKYEQMGIDQQRQAIQQIEQGPLYQELAKQGEEAILASASATGRRGSDGTQSALARYRPQLLSQLIEQQYARLGGLSNVGQASAQNLLSLGQASAAGQAGLANQSANAISSLMASQGAAQGAAQAAGIQGAAAGQVAAISGVGNALSSGIQNYALMNMLGTGGAGLGTGGFYRSEAAALSAGGGAPVAYSAPTAPGGSSGWYIQS